MTEAVDKTTAMVQLPPIPDKRYFTIGEVSRLCILKPHVLRYWEQEFTQLKPTKRRGNRRYYQYKDVLVIRKIRELLYSQGFTIQGAKQQFLNKELDVSPAHSVSSLKQTIQETVSELENVIQLLETE